MAGKITDYTPLTTLSDGDLSDWSNFDEVSAYDSRSVSWADLKTNIQNQITFDNIYTTDGSIGANRTVTLGSNDLDFAVTTGNFSIGVGVGASTYDIHFGAEFNVDGNSVNQLFVSGSADFVGVGTASQSGSELFRVGGDALIDADLTVNAVGTFEDFATNYYVLVNNTNNSGTSGIQLDAKATIQSRGSSMSNADTLQITNQGNIEINAAGSGDEIILQTQGDNHVYIGNTGNVGFGIDTPSDKIEVALGTENLTIADAGSAGATEQDWIEVKVGGNTGYIRVYATV